MYSVGEEFEIILDDTPEYFTCLANIIIKGKENIISENEEGTKRVFLFDSNEDEVVVMDYEVEEEILLIWEEEYYGTDKEYMYWNEDFGTYDKEPKKDIEYDETEELDPIEEEDLEDFIENLLD